MSAPGITYSGVLAKKGTSNHPSEGVFSGLCLWISVRVAQRKSCAEAIQENGGTIVLKESDADMLICDPAKGYAPGSYSYKLIADAIQEGSLESKDEYLCSSHVAQAGPSKVVSKPKLTRNVFTKEDDQILSEYVTEKESLGEPTRGNDIYKEFAEAHPHHTWQSWRDRWVKKLSSVSRPRPLSKGQSTPSKDVPAAPHRAASTETSPITRSRTRFTAEEDDILLEVIHDAIQAHEPWNGYEPYKRLAHELPQRTYQSWRERALNHVAKQNRDQISRWELEVDFDPNNGEDAPVENVENQEARTIEDKAGPKLQVTEQESRTATTSAAGRLIDEDNNPPGPKDATLSSAHRAKSVERAPNARILAKDDVSNDLGPFPVPDSSEISAGDEPITTKEQFYRDYNTFLESVGITKRTIPTVMGKAIALWDLWRSVRSKKMATVELDWQQIAEDLGFNWVELPLAPGEVRKCYEEHLAPFADAMMNFNDSSDEADSLEDDAGADTEEPLPSSPPMLPSLAQPSAAANLKHQHLFSYSSPKRRKIDRGREIPSTPEHMNGSRHLQPQDSPEKTSITSPLLNYGARSNTRSQAGDQIRLASSPAQPQTRKRPLEPETQDFEFSPDTQGYTHDTTGYASNDSQREPTPSQQLLLEDAATPRAQREHDPLTPTPRSRLRGPNYSHSPGNDTVRQNMRGYISARAPLSASKTRQQPQTRNPARISKSPTPTSSTARPGIRASSATVPENEPYRVSSPPKETPEDIIDRFISLGYGRDIVLRSLKATSWIVGNAGQVMEMLKQGEPLPERTTGVWTQRDDNALALVYSRTPPPDARAERRRAKEMRRLRAKHGAEQIALRKRYLLDELSE
ncbi:hypothetical protein F5Y14DRAFT_424410 [Nemania sp. NC0429]|nr:hypothetical protein F5Y14DRAFT_424410 [Nemania sp. NC0429]